MFDDEARVRDEALALHERANRVLPPNATPQEIAAKAEAQQRVTACRAAMVTATEVASQTVWGQTSPLEQQLLDSIFRAAEARGGDPAVAAIVRAQERLPADQRLVLLPDASGAIPPLSLAVQAVASAPLDSTEADKVQRERAVRDAFLQRIRKEASKTGLGGDADA